MRFLLRDRFNDGDVELDSAEFGSVKRAYLVNQELLALEEKYFLVLQNYADFERALHELALTSLLFGPKKWSEHVNDIQVVNGRLLNLLSSTKAYLDQVPQHLSVIFGDGCEEAAAFERLTKEEFDASFGYRVMTAIRNHVQHSDFPVRFVQFDSQWEEGDNNRRELCRHQASALIDVQELLANTRIRAATRDELRGLGMEQLNVKLVVRQYLSSMARLQVNVRQNVLPEATRNEELVRSLFARYEAAYRTKPASLHAIAVSEDYVEVESVPVFLENLERRSHLVQHCRVLTNLEKHYISSEE